MSTNVKSMKKTLSVLLMLAFIVTSMFSNVTMVFASGQSDVTITNLRVEYMVNPIGIDSENPRFSWIMESNTRGQKQTAYQILVSSTPNGNGDMWDSGKVESDKSVAIKYAGKALEPTTRYYWTVKVWDKDGNVVQPAEEAYFETGLMSTNGVDNWDGAKWIAMDKSFNTYVVEAKITVPSKSGITTSLIFSGKDSSNYFKWNFSKSDSGNLLFKPVCVMSGSEYPLVDGKYNPNNGAPAATETTINVADNPEITVTIEFTADVNKIATKINGSEVSTITDFKGFQPGGSWGSWTWPATLVDTLPVVHGMVGMLLSATANSHDPFTASIDDIKVIKDGEETFADSFDGSNVFDKGSIVDGKLQIELPNGQRSALALQTNYVGFAAPMLRKETALEAGKTVKNARLYISALGVYDAYINGKKVGIVNPDGSITYDMLTPGWTNYERTINYVTYDVTSYINSNKVTLAAVLGNGWYNGSIAGNNSIYYKVNTARDLGLKAKLLITYTDGSKQTIVTDVNNGWKATDIGPITMDDIYNGETYDARREIPGWNDNGFDDSTWFGVKEHQYRKDFPDAIETALLGNTPHIVDSLDQTPISITTYDEIINVGDKEKVKSGLGEIKVVESKTYSDPDTAKSVALTLEPGETAIYDLGQNMVGVPQVTLKGKAGTKVRIRFAEMLNDDSVPDGDKGADGPKGTLYLKNLRGAQATATYILKGDAAGEICQPTMTFFGYRYMEVSILEGNDPITVSNVKGKVVTSAIDRTGYIETSDEYVNKLYSNQIWGMRGNFLSIPTDCPQRDERCGWTGDSQLFSNTALYNMNTFLFLEKHEYDNIDSMYSYGQGKFFQVVAPSQRYTGNAPHSGWSDVGIVLPWTIWMMSGDDTIIRNSYDAMENYMNYIEELNQKNGTQFRGPGSQYGDWLSFQGTSSKLMSDYYYAYDAKLLSQMAAQIGKTEDAAKYAELFENIKNEIIKNYFEVDDNGKLTILSGKEPSTTLVGQSGKSENNSQTALLWALKLGIYENDDQKQQIINMLAENIKNTDEFKAAHPDSDRVNYAENTLAVGFLGVNVIAPVLTENGLADLAYRILLQDQMPSWLYSVKNGATTIWERWNSYSIEDGFGPSSMNSFNHFSYGAIAEWMYKYMAGIMYDTTNPGFKHIILQPTIDPSNEITWAKGSYDSVYGTIKSEWEVSGNVFKYEATVPANTTATLYIPTNDPSSVKECGIAAEDAEGVTFVKFDSANNIAVYELESGSYSFETILRDEFTVKTTFTVGEKDNATRLEANAMLDASAFITNNEAVSKKVLLIVALYDSNNKMVNVSYLAKEVAAGATENFHAGFKLPSDVTGYKAKAFVWEGESLNSTNMKPVSNVVEITD